MLDDLKVWLFIGLTIFVKLIMSPSLKLTRAISTASAALLTCLSLTEPILNWSGLDPDIYLIPVVVILALTGENLVRRLLDAVESEDFLVNLINFWRGK